MKVFYLSLHQSFDPMHVATGNQVRDAGIIKVLEAASHEVMQCSPLPSRVPDASDRYFVSPQDLANRLAVQKPDVIIAGYWTLLGHLPTTSVPIVLDFIAPRLLEAMFQEQGTLLHESRELLQALPRADHFLVGNQRQADLLLGLLLLSGIDCRFRVPISVVPIGVQSDFPPFQLPQSGIRLVSAGVDWPWRQSREYFSLINRWCATYPGISFRNISGTYPGNDSAAPTLLSYQQMRQLFCDSHIGLDLGRRNTEREFSQSFRLADYLACGLPVIVNPWLPLATLIREYDAGWLISEPAELEPLLHSLLEDPAIIIRKAAGARRLVAEKLAYQHACAPLLTWLQDPWRPAKSAFVLHMPAANAQLERAQRWQWQHALVQMYQLLFCRKRPVHRPDILMVTRSDLFPSDHGAAVKIVRTAEALSRLQRRVYLCTDNRRVYYCFEQGIMQVKRYPRWLWFLALPRPVGLLRLLLKGYPWSNAFLYFPLVDVSYIVRSLYLATRYAVGNYIAEFPAYVCPCRVVRKLLGGRVVLVEHNVEYERLKAQISDLPARSYQTLKHVELLMCAQADAVITVSDNDNRQLLQDGVDPRKLHTIPHGVDVAAFQNTPLIDVRKCYGIADDALLLVYHGPYSYAPNLEAMSVMARELLPRLQQRGLNVAVLAIGSKPPAQTLHPAIHFVGTVENLASVLPAADLAVVPLMEGGGTRMKILDYFAAGVPVISTSKGIEGIPVSHKVEALIIDDIEAMCDAIAALANDHDAARALTTRASRFVASLSWDAIAVRYVPLLDK